MRAQPTSGSGSFWPFTPLHALNLVAISAYFCLFAIWPALCPSQPDFRSYFAPSFYICTNLDRSPYFALLYVSVLCIFRKTCVVKVCAFAQTLTTSLMTLFPARTIARLMDNPDGIRHPLCSRRRPADRHRPRLCEEMGERVVGRSRDNRLRHTDTVHTLALGGRVAADERGVKRTRSRSRDAPLLRGRKVARCRSGTRRKQINSHLRARRLGC